MASPSSRARDIGQAVMWNGKCHITYTDWTGLPEIPLVDIHKYPPHSNGKVDRIVHKERKLTAPPFGEPYFLAEIKQKFYGTGHYISPAPHVSRVSRETLSSRNTYWISKNNSKVLNWDTDTVYIDGALNQVIDYPDDARTITHDVVVCCCYGSPITQVELDAWNVSGDKAIAALGKDKIIIIVYRYTAGIQTFRVRVYHTGRIGTDVDQDKSPLYERKIPSTDYNKAFDYIHVGFKTDGKTLVYWKSTYSAPSDPSIISGGGVFSMVFSGDYKAETITKLGSHHFAIYTQTSVINKTFYDPQETTVSTIDAAQDEALVNAGHHILCCFQDKDNFTLIFKETAKYHWHEDYNYQLNYKTTGIPTGAVNGAVDNQYNYFAYKIDWKNNSVVKLKKILSHYKQYTYTSTYGESNQSTIKNDIDAIILYADYNRDLYVYRTNTGHGSDIGSGTEIISTYDIGHKLFINHGGIETLVANFAEHKASAYGVSEIVPNPWDNYFNGTETYESDAHFLNTKNHFAFDGALLVFCLDLNDSGTNTSMQYRARFKTIIYNVNTKQIQKLDYRVDNDTDNNGFYPLTVTLLPKG